MQKVKDYILTRKKPVTVEELTKRFLVSQTTVYKAINSLLSEGRLKRVRRNGKTYFQPNPEGNRAGSGQGSRGKSLFLVQLVEAVRARQAGEER